MKKRHNEDIMPDVDEKIAAIKTDLPEKKEMKFLNCRDCVYHIRDPKVTRNGTRYLVECKGPWAHGLFNAKGDVTVMIPKLQTPESCKFFKECKEKDKNKCKGPDMFRVDDGLSVELRNILG